MNPRNPSVQMHARHGFRRLGRAILKAPHDLSTHEIRLKTALELPGSEPIQGALADMFTGCARALPADKSAALDAARPRLSPWVAQLFTSFVGASAYPRCSPMATRWSVLATPSLDMPRRALRCSFDDASTLAQDAITSWRNGDEAAQQAFLAHCKACGNTLAFALARRTLLQELPELPPPWEVASLYLQEWVRNA